MPIDEVAGVSVLAGGSSAEHEAPAAASPVAASSDRFLPTELPAGTLAPADPDVAFMLLAMAEAEAAGAGGDVPIGALVVRDGVVLGRGRNRREVDCDPTAHAEIVALREAAAATSSWRLVGATVYATLEPCPMCAGALVNARVARVVYACGDPKAGALNTLYDIGRDVRLNHRFEVRGGVLADACAGLLRQFFAARRPRKPAVRLP